MTKEEYTNKKESTLLQIQELRDSLKSLESQYIESNKPFEIGDLVLVEHNNNFPEKGFVDDYEVDWTNNIKPIIKKIKKDGTKSQHKVWNYYGSKITKIE